MTNAIDTSKENAAPAPAPAPKKLMATAQLLFAISLANKRIRGFHDPDTDAMDNSGPNVGKSTYGVRDGTIYKFVDSHWEAQEVDKLERDAIDWLSTEAPDKCTDKTAISCVNTAVRKLRLIPTAKTNVIPLKYCSLEVATDGELIKRESLCEDGLTYCLSCDYEKDAVPERFLKFIHEALPNEEVRNFLQEYVGYTLLSDTRFQVGAWLLGVGGSGKGTITQIAQALHRHTVALSLDALDGFKLAGLHSASLVVIDETPARINEQTLKTLVSGDTAQIDRKFRDPLTLRPTAKWIICGNSLPSISDHSVGFWRRWFIFPFDVVPSKKQPLLAQQIIDEELSGVLNWALEGLQRLLKRNGFPDQPPEMRHAASNGKMQSNNVAAWVQDMGIVTIENRHEDDDGNPIFGAPRIPVANTRKDIYAAYTRWCGESGTRAVASNKFWERLRLVLPDIREDRRGSGAERAYHVNIPLPSIND